jgi:long-chain acyl-CoA synthetase
VPEGERLKMFGIFAKNRTEWTLTDIAANLFGLTTIPIYDTLGDENITYVFNHTQLTTCFVSEGALKSLMKCKDLVRVSTIVCYDKFTEEQVGYFQQKGKRRGIQESSSSSSTTFTPSAKKI